MIFPNIDRAHFTRMEAQASSSGIPIQGDVGAAMYQGAKIGWAYNEATQTLAVTPENLKADFGAGIIKSQMLAIIQVTAQGAAS